MTGDELRAMISEIEARCGKNVTFHVGRVWAMDKKRFTLARILDDKIRWPEPAKVTIDEKRKASRARKQKMHDMAQSGMTHKKIADEFGISAGRVGQLLRSYDRFLCRCAENEASQ